MEVMTREELGDRLRTLRKRRGLTQEALAEAAEVSVDSVRRLENAAFSPSFDTLTKLAKGLNVPKVALITDHYDEEDDLAVMLRALPSPHKEVAVAMLGTLYVQASMTG